MFGRHEKSVTYGAVIDVGSGSVGVGILRSDQDQKLPDLLFSHRVAMRLNTEGAGSDQMRRMREALFAASLILSKEGLEKLRGADKHARISRILVTSSAPWAHTMSKNVFYEHDTDIRVSNSFIEDLIKSAEDEIAEDVAQLEGTGSQKLQVVERATVDLKINGYSTEKPAGQFGKEFSLSHIVGLLPEEIVDAVTEVQEKIFTATHVTAHTYLLVVYCVLRDLFPKMHACTIIDVTGESTEIGLVEHDVLLGSDHTSYGYNTLIRDMSAKNGGSIQDTVSSLRALSEDTAHFKGPENANASLEGYANSLREALLRLQNKRGIPQAIVITAPPQFYKLFGRIIEKTVAEVTHVPCTITEMQGKIVHEIAKGEDQDIFIAIAARFFHKLHGCGEIETR